MTEHKSEFLRKCQFPLSMVLAVNPIPLLVYVAFAPTLLPFFWVVPLACILLALLAFRVPGKYRLLYGIMGSVLLVALGALMLLAVPKPFLLVVPIVYVVVLLMSLPIAGWGTEKELPLFWYWCGLFLHIGTYVFKFIVMAFNDVDWNAIDPLLLISFFIMVILAMLLLTRVNLNSSANGRQKPSAFMWQKNYTLTIVFFVVAMLIALIPSVYDILGSFFGWIGHTIRRLIDSIEISDVVNDLGGGEGQTPTDPSSGNEEINVWLTNLLNILFYVCVFAILALCLRAIIPIIVRTIRRVFKKVLSGVTNYVNTASEDYVDEVTDLRGTLSKQKKARLSFSEERSLPPDQRIRYRYRRLMSKHPEWESGSTARENLSDQAAPFYEKARYSDHPITEEDAAGFTSNTRRV